MSRIPEGKFDVYADDDDVIGLVVAKSYPSGWPIIGTEPASMPTADEFEVAQFLADCMSNARAVQAFLRDRLVKDDQ